MSTDIPQDFGAVVRRLIAEGKFQNEQAIINEGIRLVIAREKLHADIQAGIEELDNGEAIDAEDAFAEARRCVNAIENDES